MSSSSEKATAASGGKKRDAPTKSQPQRVDNKDGGTGDDDEMIESMLFPSLYRLTEGIPRKELKLMISEAKVCEEALEKEIQELNDALANEESSSNSTSNKKASASIDAMLESEVTPPDRYFTISALLGRLRDDLATPLPPNSVLPALRAQNTLLNPPAPKKKKTSHEQSTTTAGGNTPAASTTDAASTTVKDVANNKELTTLERQKQVLALESNPEYTREHATSNVLLGLYKRLSTHRSSVVFRKPVNPKEAPGYTDRILFPMDMSMIRKMIVARNIKSYRDFHIKAGLICHNCVKYNGRESDYGVVTRDFEAIVDEHIVSAVLTAGSSSSSSNTANKGGTTSGGTSPTPAATANAQPKQESKSRSSSPVPPQTTTTMKTTNKSAATNGGGSENKKASSSTKTTASVKK